MPNMLTVVTHRAERNTSSKLLDRLLIVLLPDFMALHLHIAHLADTAVVVIFGIG